MEQAVKSILAQQTAILRSMRKQQTTLLTSMRKQQTALLTSMREQQTAMSEHQMGLLTSINQQLAKLNASNFLRNKADDEDLMEKEKQKVTKIEEVTRDSYVQQMQKFSSVSWPSSSRSAEKKYRLHIVGEVCHEAIHENGRLKMNVIKGKQIPNIEVILKHGDEQVPATHHLASVRVELVVLDANYHVEESTDWPQKEFEDHLMPMSKTSSTRMTVDRGVFSLDGGRKVYTVASIKENSWKQKVRLGVMVVHDGSVKERVLEGVSSNEFYVINERRPTCATKDSKRQASGNSELHPNGKRVNSDTTLQPRTSYSQFSGHAESPQIFGQRATGEQPSHARNACSTQNRPTTPIDARYIGGAVPSQAYAPNSGQGLAASVQTKLQEACGMLMDDPLDNQGHVVDPSSQNLMMGHAQNDIISSVEMARRIVNEFLPPALIIFKGKNPQHENLQGLRTQLSLLGDRLQAGHHPLEVPGFQNILLASIRKVTSDAKILNCPQVLDLATELPRLEINIERTTEAIQPGNNGTGGAQGQPSTPQSNKLHTNSHHGHITSAATTNDVTSAQVPKKMDINSTVDGLDAEMGGQEQDDRGRVGDDYYGGGNDGGCVGDQYDDEYWDELLSKLPPDMYDQNSF